MWSILYEKLKKKKPQKNSNKNLKLEPNESFWVCVTEKSRDKPSGMAPSRLSSSCCSQRHNEKPCPFLLKHLEHKWRDSHGSKYLPCIHSLSPHAGPLRKKWALPSFYRRLRVTRPRSHQKSVTRQGWGSRNLALKFTHDPVGPRNTDLPCHQRHVRGSPFLTPTATFIRGHLWF